MQQEQVIPKQLKKYKGTIIMTFSWVDLGILSIIAILLIVVWVTIPLNYWIKFAITTMSALGAVLSVMRIKNKEKPYVLFYRKIHHLLTNQSYSVKESTKLLNPYKEIDDGLIKLNTGSFVKVIELTGFNLFILKEQEQMVRTSAFRSFILSNPNIILYKTNLPSSLENQYETMFESLKKHKKAKIKSVVNLNLSILDKLEKDNTNTIDKYFLFMIGDKEEVNRKYHSSKRFLNQMFLNPKEVEDKNELLEVLNSFYSVTSKKINDLSKQAFKFKSNHIVINKNKYMKIYGIYELPNLASMGWLNNLSFSEDISWQIISSNYDKTKATSKLDKVIKNLEEKKVSAKKASQEVKADSYVQGLYELVNLLHADGESINSLKILLIAKANSTKKLNKLDKLLKQELIPKNIWVNDLNNLQKEAFYLLVPTANTKSPLPSVEMPSMSFALGMPFYAEIHKDKKGTYLGYSDYGANIFFDPTVRSGERKNSNIIVMGTSGSGKSTVTKKLMKDQFIKGNKIIAIDPEREYKKLCETLEGQWVNFGTDKKDSELKINPLEFMKNEGDDVNLMATHLQFLEQFFKTLFPELTQLELNILKKYLIKTYQSKKILEASNNIKSKDFPILEDVFKILQNAKNKVKDKTEQDILTNLSIYFSVFTANSPEDVLWNGHTNIDLKKTNFIVMDIFSLNHSGNKRLANAQMFLLLKLVNNEMVQNKFLKETKDSEKFFMCVIDEAHLLVDEKQMAGLNFMYEFIKRARKYNSFGMIATQNVKDFLGGNEDVKKKTSGIINTSQYSFFLNMNPGDIKDLDEVYRSTGGLTQLEKDSLMQAETGRCIFGVSTKNRKIMQVDVPVEEMRLWE